MGDHLLTQNQISSRSSGNAMKRRPKKSQVSVSRVGTRDQMRRNVDGTIDDNSAMLEEDNFSDRPSSDSSGVGDCDGSWISSGDEDLMNDILREFDSTLQLENDKVTSSSERLLRYVENNVIGNGVCFQGPFGERAATYCDYTASGRPLKFIENYIDEHVHPLYANTHTTTNFMARQTTQFRKEAREMIKTSVNANEEDVLIFSGSGTTGAIHKLVSALELNGRRAKKTIVFVGPYEHHSNILPWKEIGATVHRIRDTIRGNIDTRHLRNLLKKYSIRPTSHLLIGCFSAASNVTGIITDTLSITSILHEYGALSFWDYATAAPYLDIDMNPISDNKDVDLSKDAIFLSPHKFVGGPGTPGVLVAKRRLFRNAVPTNCGGGTVLYVTRDTHIYLKNPEEREEGGTPAIVESIRAGLVFQLKDAIGTELIGKRENEFAELAFEKFKQTQEIVILGSTTTDRLPIFSILIRHPQSNKLLHHNFVAVLLNDLYGVQVRSGCACAGPYAQDLLGIDEELASKFTYFLLDNQGRKEIRKDPGDIAEEMEIMKPGFTRLNLPYFASHEVVEYILDAVVDVAKHGWKLLPQYSFDITSGAWFHRLKGRTINGKDIILDSLHNNNYNHGRLNSQKCPYTVKHENGKARSQTFQQYLSSARKIYSGAVSNSQEFTLTEYSTIESTGVADDLIWFMQPDEAREFLIHQRQSPDEAREFLIRQRQSPDEAREFLIRQRQSPDEAREFLIRQRQSPDEAREFLIRQRQSPDEAREFLIRQRQSPDEAREFLIRQRQSPDEAREFLIRQRQSPDEAREFLIRQRQSPDEAREFLIRQRQSPDVKVMIHKKAPFTPKKYADENWKPTVNKKKHCRLPTASNTAKSSVCNIL